MPTFYVESTMRELKASQETYRHSNLRLIAAIVTTLFLLTGCTTTQIQYQALAHKSAVASSGNKILLQNILRSSKNLSIDYTAITEYNAKEVLSGSLGLNIPFGGDATDLYTATPGVTVGPGIASMKITNYGIEKESAVELYKESNLEHFKQLFDAGWSPDLVFTLLVQKIIFRGALAMAIYDKSNSRCNGADKTSQPPDPSLCYAIKHIEKIPKCKDELSFESQPDSLFINLGNDECEFWRFQAALARHELAGLQIDPRHPQMGPWFRADELCSEKPSSSNGKTQNEYKNYLKTIKNKLQKLEHEKINIVNTLPRADNGEPIPDSPEIKRLEDLKSNYRETLNGYKLQCIYDLTELQLNDNEEEQYGITRTETSLQDCLEQCLEEKKIECGEDTINKCLKDRPDSLRQAHEIKPRTVHEIIRFLGQVTQAQLHAKKGWTPSIPVKGQFDPVPLFVVRQGAPGSYNGILIIDFQGEKYFLSESGYGPDNADHTLEIFTYVRERVDQAFSKTTLPKTNTFLLQ